MTSSNLTTQFSEQSKLKLLKKCYNTQWHFQFWGQKVVLFEEEKKKKRQLFQVHDISDKRIIN